MKQTLQEKQDEKGRLAKQYRANKRAKWEAFCAQEPRITQFAKDIRALKSPPEILTYLRGSWVMDAPTEARIYALRIIDKHANRMVLAAGGSILDDPLPPKRNLYMVAKEILRVY